MGRKSENSLRRLPSAGAVEHGYPAGHLGHLTNTESKALEDFKLLIQEKGLYQPGPPPSHSDPMLIRYLRARKWNVQDAYGQFSDTEVFRKANQIDILYDTMDVDMYESSKKLYPRFTGRRDKRGIPIYLYAVSQLDSKSVAAYEKSTEWYSKAKADGKTPARQHRLFALYEDLTRFIQPLSTECTDRPHAEVPITLSTNIVDISGVGLRMFWNLKEHMQAASQLATAHYPELLDRIFIVGAPYFFSTVWGWIKRWFDPVTVSKIFILGPDDVLPVLSSFIDIKDIPKQYGGQLEWSFLDEPAFDDEILRISKFENGHTKFPGGPMIWRPIDNGERLECVAVGCKGGQQGQQRMERVCTIPVAFPHKNDTEPTTEAEVGVEEATAPAAIAAGEKKEISAVTEKKPSEALAPEIPVAGVAALTVSGEKEDSKAQVTENSNGMAIPPKENTVQ